MREKLIFHEDLESLNKRIPNFSERRPRALDDGEGFNQNLTDALEIIEIPLGQIVWNFQVYRGWENVIRQVTQAIRSDIQTWSDHRYMYENHVWHQDEDDLYEVIASVSNKLNLANISTGSESDYKDFNLNKHSLFIMVLADNEPWRNSSDNWFVLLNGVDKVMTRDRFQRYALQWSFARPTGLFYYTDYRGQSLLSEDRNYTKCYNCNLYDKPRSRMVTVKDFRPRQSQKNWTRAKNLCDACVNHLEDNLLAYFEVPVDYNDASAYDYLVVRPGEQTSVDSERVEQASKTAWGSSNVGRFMRRNMDLVIYIIDGETLTLGESINFEYPFEVHSHSWNYRPSFYYTHNSGHPGSELQSVSTTANAGLNFHTRCGPFLGMELEVTVREDRVDQSAIQSVMEKAVRLFHPGDYPNTYRQQGPHQLLFRKDDGSLDSYKGTEYVSMPLSLDYWNNEVPDVFWNYLKDNFRALNDDRCGIHIHVPWESLIVVERWIFLEMLDTMVNHPLYKPLFQTITQRPSVSYARWDRITYEERGRDEEGNLWKAKQPVFNVALNEKQTNPDYNAKYMGLNTLHDETMELRYFQGNTGRNGILGKAQFVGAMWDIAKAYAHPFRDWDYQNDDNPPSALVDIINQIQLNAGDILLGWITVASTTDEFAKRHSHTRYDQLRNLIAAAIERGTYNYDFTKSTRAWYDLNGIARNHVQETTNDKQERTG